MLATSIKWGNSPVTLHSGSIDDIRRHIPSFERRPFALSDANNQHFRENLRLDTVVRLPHEDDAGCVPVGVVSKDYVLLPHTQVLDLAVQALEKATIDPADVRAELRISELGERMALAFVLPAVYQFDPGDGHPMEARLECLNSVDGSTRFRVEMGWFRLVCSNGLGFHITRSEADRRHVGNLQSTHISAVLNNGLRDYQLERDDVGRWVKTAVGLEAIGSWADGELRRHWGFKAAARAFHIARHGHDARILAPFKGRTPTNAVVQQSRSVPGSRGEAANLFDVSQILAWLAKERRDVQEQVERRAQIPALMADLELRARSAVSPATTLASGVTASQRQPRQPT